MTTIGLIATDQLLEIVLQPRVASGDHNSVTLHVDFDSEWDGYGKSAVFYTAKNKQNAYEAVLVDGECVVPHEVLTEDGILYIGVRGVNAENAVKTSSLIKYRIVEGAPAGEGTTVEPTPDVYQQLMAAYGKTATSAEVANARVSALVASHSTGGAEVYRIDIDSDTKSYIKIESNGVVATAFINDYRPFNAREERMYTIPGRFAAHSIPHYEDIDNFTVSVSPGYGQPIDAAGIFARNNSDDDDAILMSTFTYNLDIIPIPAELADIRVGADGTTYETAGDVVRNHEEAINALQDKVTGFAGTADHIVAQGKKNGWDYRIWASGTAECWRTATATVKTTDWKDSGMMSFPLLSNFGLFWTKEMVSGKDIRFDYPFTFDSRPTETACLTNGTVWFPLSLIATTNKQLNRTDSYRICTYKQPDQDIEVTLSFHVIGKCTSASAD